MPLVYSQASTWLQNLLDGAYIGLSTTTPNRDGSGVSEPSGNGYGRRPLHSEDMIVTNDGQAKNVKTLYFEEATGDWGNCTTFCLFKSETGALVAYQTLSTPIHPTNGKVPLIRANNLVITM